jgi:hypothetical protein
MQGGIMRKTRVWITLSCCLLAVALLTWAQVNRKPGLWEMTSTRTFQQTPLPPGMTLPPGAHSPFSTLTTTTQVCLTQAMIDKYGIPTSFSSGCKLTNVVLKATSVSGEVVCTGTMNMTGTWQSSWSDPEHAKGSTHFVGTAQMGKTTGPVEFTTQTISVYKGPDCGSVKPPPMPTN